VTDKMIHNSKNCTQNVGDIYMAVTR
jgi:hypothetical protein